MKTNKKGNITAVTTVGIGVVLLILIYGVFAVLGAKVNTDFQTTSLMCTGTATWNATGNGCYNVLSVANYSATSQAGLTNLNVSSGMLTAGAQTPTIASVGGFVVIIAMLSLVAGYAFNAFRG